MIGAREERLNGSVQILQSLLLSVDDILSNKAVVRVIVVSDIGGYIIGHNRSILRYLIKNEYVQVIDLYVLIAIMYIL